MNILRNALAEPAQLSLSDVDVLEDKIAAVCAEVHDIRDSPANHQICLLSSTRLQSAHH